MSKKCGCCGKPPDECSCWESPGFGKVQKIVDLAETPSSLHSEPEVPREQTRLGVWRATAICGNDITSSCLYVSALAALYAGPLAPLALLLVAGVLYLFRGIYAEVGSALPLNGGAYNVLLNTTTKARAATAACLTLLSYVATAVISGSEAMHYAAELLPGLNVLMATVILLGGFAMLNVLGISDSASVALAIFLFHLFTLSVLVLIGIVTLAVEPSIMLQNLQTPISQWPTPRSGGVLIALFFGFSAAMLGISGFESSANYIEEQQPGVFPKTLRNMWIAVALFNPVISFLSFAMLPMAEIANHKEALLSEMGRRAVETVCGERSGTLLPKLMAGWISLDAVVVLSGAVLTSYVGVTGLASRMSMDLCLPQFLLRQNQLRGTRHWIIVSFFLTCCSILIITAGKIEMLAGVYTLSFLAVMALFAVGNLLLKKKHPDLRRTSRARVSTVVLALIGVSAALVGNIVVDPEYVRVFLAYFLSATALVALMFFRSAVLTIVLRLANRVFEWAPLKNMPMRGAIASWLQAVQCRSIIFIASQGTKEEFRNAAEYVRRNEQMQFLKIVWFYESEKEIPDSLAELRDDVDREFSRLHIDLLLVRGVLVPELLADLGRRLGVPPNYMFITTSTAATVEDIACWGGVRIVA